MTDPTPSINHDATDSQSRAGVGALKILAAVTTCLYGVISWLSWQFTYESVTTDRPIIVVMCLFTLAFFAYLYAIRVAWRAREHRHVLRLIVVSALLFRVVMLFSYPIQEVDIYRYLWDGAVSTHGVSPFRFSPAQVHSASITMASGNADLDRLVELRDHNPPLAEILDRVHFAELPTIYPPTSQAVFAIANLTTPGESSLLTRLFIMKGWFIALDVATLFVVIGLLRVCQKPDCLCVIYAWCPLLMKEVANSGHLDAIAVFLTALAIYLVVRFLSQTTVHQALHRRTMVSLGAIGTVLALAVGAKLYPVVLAPLFFFGIARKTNYRIAIVPATVFLIVTALLLSPMFSPGNPDPADQVSSDPSLGVVTFLRRWEMNDFLFLVLIENLTPTISRGPHEMAWFVVVPETIRQTAVDAVASRFDVGAPEVPFLVSRVITAFVFVVIAVTLAWRAAQKDVSRFCEAAFLSLAWFWLLAPTQNPWYWTWALPFLPFARSRVWLAVSGLAMLYYLRFWLSYHFEESAVLGSPYTGAAFFDFVVTWVEFAPWFVLLAAEFLTRRYGFPVARKQVQTSSDFNRPSKLV